MTKTKTIAALATASLTLLALSACSSTTGGSDTGAAAVPGFEINSVSITPMTTANLCRDLGGTGAAPTVTVTHTATAGVPIRLHLQDRLSDGSTFDHRNTRVSSDASGTTTVAYGFLPPCNTTAGRLDSNYQLTIQAGGDSETVTWARFDSGSRTIR